MHIAPFLREHSVHAKPIFEHIWNILFMFICLCRILSFVEKFFICQQLVFRRVSRTQTLTPSPPPFPPIATARWYKCVTYCFMIFFERIPRSKSLIKQPNTFSVKCSIYMSNSYYIFSCSNKSIKVQARKFENF